MYRDGRVVLTCETKSLRFRDGLQGIVIKGVWVRGGIVRARKELGWDSDTGEG